MGSFRRKIKMNFHNIIVVAAFVVGIFFFSHGSFAASTAPVVDVTQPEQMTNSNAQPPNSATVSDISLPTEHHVSPQVQHMIQMNLPQQINDLQHKIQQLQGQLRIQQHDIELLNIQQRSFYEDLNQRLNQISTLSSHITSNHGPRPSISNQTITVLPVQHKVAKQTTNDTHVYQHAFQLIIQKKYNEAQDALQDYLAQYSSGSDADSAHYWLGQIYLLQNKLTEATKEFQTVVDQYKTSNKIPDSKLKLASIHLQQGNVRLAKNEMQQIKKEYPNSTAAQLAIIQLQQLNDTNREN